MNEVMVALKKYVCARSRFYVCDFELDAALNRSLSEEQPLEIEYLDFLRGEALQAQQVYCRARSSLLAALVDAESPRKEAVAWPGATVVSLKDLRREGFLHTPGWLQDD